MDIGLQAMPRYDAGGRLKEKWLPNGVNSRYAYFTDNTLAQVVNRSLTATRDTYLLELARYVVLNPLRARMVKRLEIWPWSSYLATCGQAESPPWLHTDWLLAQFGRRRSSRRRQVRRFRP